MLNNYIKIAFRNIMRQKGYSFINISGLGVGMAACILILLNVQDELSYDKYHDKSDRIYRVTREWKNADGETSLHLGHVAPPFAPLLKNDFEGIVLNAVRFNSGYGPLMSYGDTKIVENRYFWVDADVFEVFSWEMINGDPQSALVEPNSLVLTQTTAKKYFKDEDPLGKTMTFNNFGFEVEMKVTGVVEDVPLNSHFKFDILASFQTLENFIGAQNMMSNFGSNNYATYLLFPEGYNIEDFRSQLPDFSEKHLGPTNSGAPVWDRNQLHLMKIGDIHLHSHLDSEIEANSDIAYVYIFAIIAILTLVIACINFMNLATAKSARRAQEVGLRKVMGAFRMALVRQFITESILFAILALVLAIGIVYLALPTFNDFISKDLSLDLTENLFVLFLLIGITIFVGVVAGSYPAFYLSSFQPASILKGEHKSTRRTVNLRSILVVLQFCISIVLIIGVGIVQDQLEYMRTKKLGFDQDNMLILPSNQQIYDKFESIKQQLEAKDGIIDVTLASRIPSGRLLDSQGAQAEIDGEIKRINFRIADIHVDHDYLTNFGVDFVAGRNFDHDIASDSSQAFILNEAAVSAIGWESPEVAIDKQFNYGNRQGGRIIGVVKDFHFESLHQPIAPIVFFVTSGRNSSVAIRVKPGKEEEILDYVREQWSFLNPGFPFTFSWVDESFSQQYANEDNFEKIVKYFSILAVVIASLGLFGLASYTAEQRIKEIGIRKVMGASVAQIITLLTKGFTKLVIIAFLIAIPIAYYFMEMWLQAFAYSGEIQVTAFLYAGILALIIAWITVVSQTLKAALTNPVDSIRYD